jgi:hypothetical protein
MLWDTFWITGPVVGLPSELRITCETQLARLAHVLPVGATSGSATREAFVQTNETLDDAHANILAEISLPDRYDGRRVPDNTLVVSKRVTNSRAKVEIDNLAYLGGGTMISSQGRIRFVQLFESTEGVRAVFPRGEVQTFSTDPGWERRLPVTFVKYDWSDTARGFRKERRSVHENSLLNLGRTFGQSDEWVDENITRWIVQDADADTIGERHVQAFGVGLITWEFGTSYQFPELEIGDCVVAETDVFIARDPNSDREIVGRAWASGIIVGHNRLGNRFVIWVPSFADILAASTAVTTEGRAVVTRYLAHTAFRPVESTAVGLEYEDGYLVLESNPFPQECWASIDRPAGATAILDVRMRSLCGDGSTNGAVEVAIHESADGTGTDIVSTVRSTDAGTWATTEANSIGTPPVTLTAGTSISARCFLTPTDDPLQARLLWVEVDFEVVIQ